MNIKGRTGCNIPCDLHLEHLNRRLKSIINNMGSNVTKSSFKQAAASINVVNHISQKFEEEVQSSQILTIIHIRTLRRILVF